MSEMEIDAQQAKVLVQDGKRVYVFINDYGELNFVSESLGAKGEVHNMDIAIAREIIFNQDKKAIEKMAAQFKDAIIVCPHGRTSLRFATALKELGIRAYSLHGGTEGLKQR